MSTHQDIEHGRRLFELVRDPLFVSAPDGRLVRANSAGLDLLGITHEEGLSSEENVAKPDTDTLKSAATELSSKYPKDDVTLYFSTLVSQDPETWGALAELGGDLAG